MRTATGSQFVATLLRGISVLGMGIAISAGPVHSQAEIRVDGRLVDTRADGPCYSAVSRYTDCGNGTVIDSVTGLIWLQDSTCDELTGLSSLAQGNWPSAMEAVAQLAAPLCGLSDGSQPGDWRLPTPEEWQRTMARAVALGCLFAGSNHPTLTDDAGTACLASGSTSFTGGVTFVSTFWSNQSVDAGSSDNARGISLWTGALGSFGKSFVEITVWPVRSAP